MLHQYYTGAILGAQSPTQPLNICFNGCWGIARKTPGLPTNPNSAMAEQGLYKAARAHEIGAS
ncbi:MAG: hypothetical protein KC776_11445 [Myxococcales bacterium]|nr:hypothetical protein [Myxococcales bacterium]